MWALFFIPLYYVWLENIINFDGEAGSAEGSGEISEGEKGAAMKVKKEPQ